MGERVVGRPAWAFSSTTRPSSNHHPSSSERSAWGSKAASPREVSSEVMKSRGSEKERDRGRETSRSRKRRRRFNRSPSLEPTGENVKLLSWERPQGWQPWELGQLAMK